MGHKSEITSPYAMRLFYALAHSGPSRSTYASMPRPGAVLTWDAISLRIGVSHIGVSVRNKRDRHTLGRRRASVQAFIASRISLAWWPWPDSPVSHAQASDFLPSLASPKTISHESRWYFFGAHFTLVFLTYTHTHTYMCICSTYTHTHISCCAVI